MRVRTALPHLVVVGFLLLVLPSVALAVKPEPGQFTGSIAIPRFEGTSNELKTQRLQFAVAGNGRRIAAFDIPSCTDRAGAFLFTRKVVRPRVSRTGRIAGSLVHEQGGGGQTLRRWSVRVTGKFVRAKRARGRVSVTVTIFRARPGEPRRQLGQPCKASGGWSARHGFRFPGT